MMKTNKVALLGLMSALALVLSFAENMLVPDIPFLPVGAKPGLSNIVTMLVACYGGIGGAMCITFVKVVFALITRGVTASFMSFCGGILSTTLICILIKHEGKLFSFLGIGISGAIMHNLGQLIAACVISGTIELFNYGKYLLIFSLITGAVTGSILLVVMPRIKSIGSLNNKKTAAKAVR